MNWLIVTAANRGQAHGYRIQLQSRELSGSTKWMVIPDPRNRRVGSGGSTIWALHQLSKVLRKRKPRARSVRELFEGERILLIHSGGDSRRLISYAPQGKLFVPLPCSTKDGRPAALFDLILSSLQSLPVPSAGQVLIASGDVLLNFDPNEVEFARPGIVGVCYPSSLERGARHGVYVAARDGTVMDFLQKPDEAAARDHRAVDAAGRVLVDTGLVSLDPPTAERWLSVQGVLRDLEAGCCPVIDLYEHLLPAAIPSGGRNSSHLPSALYKAVHGSPFHVCVLPYCDFFHVGSTRELISNVGMLNRTARAYGFSNFDHSHIAERASLEGAFVYNSILSSKEIRAGDGVFLEAVHTGQKIDLPGPNVVVNWPEEAREPLLLPPGKCVVCLPIGSDKWSTLLFDVDDNFKNPPALWEDKRWAVTSVPSMSPEPVPRLYSIRQLLTMVNHDRLLEHRREIQRLSELHSLGDTLRKDPWFPASRLLSLIRTRSEARRAQAAITGLLAPDDVSQAHLYRYSQVIRQHFGVAPPSRPELTAHALEKLAFDAVAQAVARQIVIPDEPLPPAILPDQVVWATSPVRIDLAGGWSDTPPICTELGGTVLNACITLNGQFPVQVMAKLNRQPVIRLNSLDLGERIEISETPTEDEYRDPSQWYALPKAALMLAGAIPRDSRYRLKQWLARSGGLDITVFSALPKGSGLGTSSILGAAMLACLARIRGEKLAVEDLIARTSMLEQVMTTGGGWQDQIGGIVPGVKLIRTDPGPSQIPKLHWVRFDMSPGSPLACRSLLYYTGYKRMAKNILQKVVGHYLSRDPEAIAIIHDLKELAEKMERDLGGADIDGFGRGIERYWQLKKQLDPGSSNPQIEALLRPIEQYLTGKLLPGAGGGGFVYMIARDADAAAQVRRKLRESPPNALGRIFDFQVDDSGLQVTVL